MIDLSSPALWRVNPFDALRHPRSFRDYLKDYREFQRQSPGDNADFPLGKFRPYLKDRFDSAGSARGHYFHQDLLVARRIFENAPRRHMDIGSRIDGFVAHVAAFRDIDVLDIRALPDSIPHVHFVQADIMSPLPATLHGATDSLSCLHAIEHFGLGRYGDPVRRDGHLAAIENMAQLLTPGGRLYLSTPIGANQRIEFHAHRVFSVKYLLDKLTPQFELVRFSYIGDDGALRENAPLTPGDADRSFNLNYGCGVFEMTRRA